MVYLHAYVGVYIYICMYTYIALYIDTCGQIYTYLNTRTHVLAHFCFVLFCHMS